MSHKVIHNISGVRVQRPQMSPSKIPTQKNDFFGKEFWIWAFIWEHLFILNRLYLNLTELRIFENVSSTLLTLDIQVFIFKELQNIERDFEKTKAYKLSDMLFLLIFLNEFSKCFI